jgi:hypothetical protein
MRFIGSARAACWASEMKKPANDRAKIAASHNKVLLATHALLIGWIGLLLLPLYWSTTRFGAVNRNLFGAHGTLIVAIPTSKSIIVAADTRSTTMGVACDGDTKVAITKTAEPILVATTATATWISAKAPLWPDDPCGDLKKNGAVFFDAKAITTFYLEQNGKPLWDLDLQGVAGRLIAEVTRVYNSGEPAAGYVRSLAGRTMFQIVLAAYRSEDATSYVKAIQLNLSSTGKITANLSADHKFDQESQPDWPYFGDTEHYDLYVFNGSGKRFLPASLDELKKKDKVADVSEALAKSVAVGMIEAAEQTQAIEPTFKSIGGPIEVFSLGAVGAVKLQ